MRRDLRRHLAAQPRIPRQVDLAHPTRPEQRDKLVVAELPPRHGTGALAGQ